MFICVHSLSLELKGTMTIARGSLNATTATSDTATSDTATTSGHDDAIAFLEERVAILSQRADEAAAFAREVAADAQDFNNANASIFCQASQDVAAIRKFRKSNIRGYNYARDFEIEEAETLDGSQRLILKHKNSGGIVSHMLNIFDVIQEAHCRHGHMKAEK